MEDMNQPAPEPTNQDEPIANEGSNEPAMEGSGSESSEATPLEGSEQQPEEAVESGDDEYVTDEQGNKFLPADKVQGIIAKRLAAMADQKNNAVSSFIESLKSDPTARQQALEALGPQPQASGEANTEDAAEPSQFDSWLTQSVTPEFHAQYRGMANAMHSVQEAHFRKMLNETVQPLVAYIGKQQVESFKTSTPDYPKYERTIQDLIRTGRAKTIQDAYIIASHTDKIKGAGASAVRDEQTRRTKQASNPIRRTQGSNGQTKPKFNTIQDAFRHEAKRLGME